MKRYDHIVPNILRELDQPDWLLPGERITFHWLGDLHAFDGRDGVFIRAVLESRTRQRETRGGIDGHVWRAYSYTNRESLIIDVVTSLHDLLVTRLRLALDHPLKDLALRALNGDDDLRVFMDALIERREISEGADVMAQALGFARSIAAPMMFDGWTDQRWPVNDELRPTHTRLFGTDGPELFERGEVDWSNCTIRVMGKIAVAETAS